jgi:DNA-binding MarR family transcriptional regulator
MPISVNHLQGSIMADRQAVATDLRGLVPEAGRCNGTALRKATRRVSQIYDAALAPCGLRSTQRSILVSIARAGTPNMGELAAALVLDRSALAHNLKPLEREGLVESFVDQADRRSRLVRLTEAGRNKLAESLPLWEVAQRRFEAAFGEAEARTLRGALDIIAAPGFARLTLPEG